MLVRGPEKGALQTTSSVDGLLGLENVPRIHGASEGHSWGIDAGVDYGSDSWGPSSKGTGLSGTEHYRYSATPLCFQHTPAAATAPCFRFVDLSFAKPYAEAQRTTRLSGTLVIPLEAELAEKTAPGKLNPCATHNLSNNSKSYNRRA